MIDGLISVIGSMNLDLRSKLQNSEIALLIRSGALTQQATALIENTFNHDAYRVERDGGGLVWRAPPGAGFQDAHGEPDASVKLKLMVKLLGPFAPDEML
jgi:phosphatidylserine/phosphatidylglycerophosphate/cardiolipin synthase-like enzyme